MTQRAAIILVITALLHNPLHAAADLELTGLDKQKHNIASYIGQGKWTVLNIWGTQCPPCQEEIPELTLFHDKHHQDKATVLGIAIDFPSYGYANLRQVKQFVEDYLVSFPVLLSDASVTERLGLGRLEGLPTTYMYTPDGELAAYQVGGITRDIIESFIRRYESRKVPLIPEKK